MIVGPPVLDCSLGLPTFQFHLRTVNCTLTLGLTRSLKKLRFIAIRRSVSTCLVPIGIMAPEGEAPSVAADKICLQLPYTNIINTLNLALVLNTLNPNRLALQRVQHVARTQRPSQPPAATRHVKRVLARRSQLLTAHPQADDWSQADKRLLDHLFHHWARGIVLIAAEDAVAFLDLFNRFAAVA